MSETNFYDVLLAKKLSGGSGKGGGITVKDAKVGQLIRAKKVDETGNITEYEPVPFMYDSTHLEFTFPEQDVSGFAEAQPGLYAIMGDPTNTELISGKSYDILWEGVPYTLVCKSFVYSGVAPGLGIGNLSIFGIGDDTGEPFTYININNQEIFWATKSTGEAHKIGVGTSVGGVIKIPKTFYDTPKSLIFTEQEDGSVISNFTPSELINNNNKNYTVSFINRKGGVNALYMQGYGVFLGFSADFDSQGGYYGLTVTSFNMTSIDSNTWSMESKMIPFPKP